MPLLFCDASALAKRYTEEIGSDTVHAIFGTVLVGSMVTTVWGYAETFSILLRGWNGGRIDHSAFTAATALLQREVVNSGDFGFLDVDEAAVFASLPLMQRHSLNATDAALLAAIPFK